MKRSVFVCAAIACLSVSSAVAQETATASTTATITIPEVLYIEVDPAAIGFGTIGSTQFNAGRVDAAQQSQVKHRANVGHYLTVHANNPGGLFEVVNPTAHQEDPEAEKPLTEFRWMCVSSDADSGDGTTSCATGTDAADFEDDVSIVHAANHTGGTTVAGASRGQFTTVVDYRVLLDYDNDTPGTYRVNLVYTVVSEY